MEIDFLKLAIDAKDIRSNNLDKILIDNIYAVATDGHRLHYQELSEVHNTQFFNGKGVWDFEWQMALPKTFSKATVTFRLNADVIKKIKAILSLARVADRLARVILSLEDNRFYVKLDQDALAVKLEIACSRVQAIEDFEVKTNLNYVFDVLNHAHKKDFVTTFNYRGKHAIIEIKVGESLTAIIMPIK